MFSKLANSWDLVKASARVLAADKELLIFPILSSIGVLIVTLTFALPFFLSNFFDSLVSDRMQVAGFLVMFLFYIVQYTVIFFANTALVGAALIRLRGGDPTVRDGMRIAFSKLGPILGYALISATVGMLLRTISQRSRGLGRFIISLIGFTWNIATYLVVPVLAIEDVGPVDAIKRSVALLKKTWGEQIAGNFGLGAAFGLIYVVIILLGLAGVFLATAIFNYTWVYVFIGVMVVLLLTATGLINSTLSGIYSAAVYEYATTGETNRFFDSQVVQNTFYH